MTSEAILIDSIRDEVALISQSDKNEYISQRISIWEKENFKNTSL
jgi:beta-lactamase superfamily II metal-dependent hydrolase